MTNGKTPWKCPKCGRQFAKRNQAHSCTVYSIENHFQDKPAHLKAIFDLLLAKMKQFGTVRIDAVKSSINFAGKSHFAGMHVQKDSLRLGFILERNLNDKRIIRTEKLGEPKYFHSVKLARKEDIDAQLLEWIKEAYYLKQ